MGLIACRECGTQVSNEAAACPKCGIKSPARKPTSFGDLLKYGVLGFIALAIIGSVIGGGDNSAKAPGSTAGSDSAAPVNDTSMALARASAAAKVLRQNMRNPRSFELVTALLRPSDGSACLTYRAENGFGGMNVERAIAFGEDVMLADHPQFKAKWNSTCTSGTVDGSYQARSLVN